MAVPEVSRRASKIAEAASSGDRKTAKQLRADKKKIKKRERHEAKLARKKNAPKAVQRTDENKAQVKAQKKLASEPKRKARLLARQRRLEEKASKLLNQAKQAAAEYQKLVDGEEAKKSKTETTEHDSDVISIGSLSDSSSSSSSDSDSEAEVDASKDTPLPSKVPANEVVMKRRRTSSVASEHGAVDVRASLAAAQVDSKKVSDDEGDSNAEVQKSKKSKNTDEALENASAEDDTKSEKKKKKEKSKKEKETKRKREAEPEQSDETKEVSSAKKDKKAKKAKKEKTADAGAEAEQWHAEALEGGAKRQEKFLRLLGGKKAGATSQSSNAAKDASSSIKAEADIQRQFEQGMKMKNEGGNHRRGLGA